MCVKTSRPYTTQKPRAIVAKFNYFPDSENIPRNPSKLKGTIPEEICDRSEEETTLPETKKAKAIGKRAKLVRDKLIIEGCEVKPSLQFNIPSIYP